MLGVKAYPAEYIEAVRAKFEADIAAYEAATAKAPKDAKATFETVFYNNLVVLLEFAFVHRLRTVEGKDGNPMNEVRVLANSIQEHGGVLTPDKTIKLVPEKSILKFAPGDTIAVTADGFRALSNAYFDGIVAKFS